MVPMMLAALFLGGADPAVFDLVPTDSITSPPDANDEVEWASSDMIPSFGWKPKIYRADLIRELLGEPAQLAPDVTGWGFAFAEAPDFGVMLMLRGEAVIPQLWNWGPSTIPRMFEVGHSAYPRGSAWLNALSTVYDGLQTDPN